nr:hypothetical protein [Dyadobacter sp. NIV53]
MKRQKKVEPEQQPVTTEPKPPVYEKSNGSPVTNLQPVSSSSSVNTVVPVAAPVQSTKLRSTTQLIPSAPVQTQPSREENPIIAVSQPSTTMVDVEELTLENLQSAWYEFAGKRNQVKNSTTEEIALRKEFKLVGTSIEIILDNDHQLDAIQGMRYDLLSFLKNRFHAPKLDINPRVAPHEVKKVPYTAAEKFNFMAEKNPHLLKLKQALGLDADF